MRFFLSCLFLAAFAAECAPSVEQIFKAGILPDCQQLIYCENAALAANPLLVPYWSEFSKEKTPEIPAGAEQNESLSGVMKVVRAVMEKMPIRDFSAVKRSQICVDWSVAVADSKTAYKTVKYLLVYELNAPWTPTAVKALVSQEAEDQKVALNCVFDDEQEILTISYPAMTDLPSCSIAFFQANQVLMIGEASLLQAAAAKVKRLIPPPTLSSAMQDARDKIAPDTQFYMLFAPDDNMRAVMQNKAPDSPVAPTVEEIVCATFSLQARDTLALRLGLEFSTPQTANMGKAMLLDGFFMGMVRMYLMQNASPELPMLKTMGTSLDGSHTAFSCFLTQEDIKIITPIFRKLFHSFAERAAQQ
ncbi:MAG: hypothetical protein WCT05_06570 [Lentisphaeria bacterium]